MTLAIILAILSQLADIYTTRRVLAQGGVEKNPIVRAVMERTDKWWLIKLAVTLGAHAYLIGTGAIWLSVILSAVMFGVAVLNWGKVK